MDESANGIGKRTKYIASAAQANDELFLTSVERIRDRPAPFVSVAGWGWLLREKHIGKVYNIPQTPKLSSSSATGRLDP